MPTNHFTIEFDPSRNLLFKKDFALRFSIYFFVCFVYIYICGYMRIYIHIHIYVYLHTYKIHRHIYISPNISAEGKSLGNLMCQRRNLRIKSHITGMSSSSYPAKGVILTLHCFWKAILENCMQSYMISMGISSRTPQ